MFYLAIREETIYELGIRMAIKTLKDNELDEIAVTVLSSGLLLVAIKAELRSNSRLLETTPTHRGAKRSRLDGYFLSRVHM